MKKHLIKLIPISILVILTYIPTFIWMFQRWNAKDSYYSHGFLVPFASIFIIWSNRKELGSIKIKPANLGWFFFISGIFIHTVSAVWRVYFTSGFSLILVLIGLILLFLGRDFLRQALFPVSFFIFMVPLPLVAVATISFKLKIFAAKISTIIINNLGIAAVREGSVIRTAQSYLIVEDPCSGIRSLIALIALGALMAYFSEISRLKKGILFASSIPVALSCNVVRIVTLCLISDIYGAKWTTGIYETVMGLLVFVFAFFGLLLVENILK